MALHIHQIVGPNSLYCCVEIRWLAVPIPLSQTLPRRVLDKLTFALFWLAPPRPCSRAALCTIYCSFLSIKPTNFPSFRFQSSCLFRLFLSPRLHSWPNPHVSSVRRTLVLLQASSVRQTFFAPLGPSCNLGLLGSSDFFGPADLLRSAGPSCFSFPVCLPDWVYLIYCILLRLTRPLTVSFVFIELSRSTLLVRHRFYISYLLPIKYTYTYSFYAADLLTWRSSLPLLNLSRSWSDPDSLPCNPLPTTPLLIGMFALVNAYRSLLHLSLLIVGFSGPFTATVVDAAVFRWWPTAVVYFDLFFGTSWHVLAHPLSIYSFTQAPTTKLSIIFIIFWVGLHHLSNRQSLYLRISSS